jgi:hypothetical protein
VLKSLYRKNHVNENPSIKYMQTQHISKVKNALIRV